MWGLGGSTIKSAAQCHHRPNVLQLGFIHRFCGRHQGPRLPHCSIRLTKGVRQAPQQAQDPEQACRQAWDLQAPLGRQMDCGHWTARASEASPAGEA